MHRSAKIAGLATAGTALVPFALAALLASLAAFPKGDGSAVPLLVWPLKIAAFAVAVGLAALLGLVVAGAVMLAARLLDRPSPGARPR